MKIVETNKIILRAKKTLEIEFSAVKDQIKHINNEFVKSVKLINDIVSRSGKVMVTGVGKSGLVARKISATFSSVGIPAVFVHLSELAHGDLGMITSSDLVFILSYSGESDELKKILPSIKIIGSKIVVMTGRKKSFLGRFADCILDVSVKKEACPYNLVPTSSTTAMISLGDAVALAAAEIHGFKKDDYALFHPGGTLGRRLTLKVRDLMRTGKNNPKINVNSTVKEALVVMTKTKLGAVNVVDNKDKLVGYFTDGDLRRKLQIDNNILNRKLKNVMTKNPKAITEDQFAEEAAKMIKKYNCDNLPVVDNNYRPIGMIDERDLIAVGIV